MLFRRQNTSLSPAEMGGLLSRIRFLSEAENLASFAHRIGQIGRLRGRPDVTVAACVPLQRKGSRPRFQAIGRNSYDWNFELIVREYEMVAKSAVRLKLDWPTVNRNLRLGMGAAVEDQVGRDLLTDAVEQEPAADDPAQQQPWPDEPAGRHAA